MMILGGFNPLKIPGCALWLEADRGITLDGSNNVSAWADQSGNGRHVSQSDPAKRLVYNPTGANGRPSLDDDATVERTIDITGMTGLSGIQKLSVICLLKINNYSQYAIPWRFPDFIMHQIIGGKYYFGSTDGAYPVGQDVQSGGDPQIIIYTYDGSGATEADKYKAYRDGAPVIFSSYVGVGPATLAELTWLSISNVNGDGSTIAFLMYPHIVFTDTQRQYLTNGFANKYGITVA